MTRKTKEQMTSTSRSRMRQPTPFDVTTARGRTAPAGGLFWGLFLLFAWAGCADRTYLTKSHGRANSEAFGRQMANPNPQPKGKRGDATQGLDSQEATAVAGAYRRSLAGREGGDTKGQQMVIMNPAAAQQGGNMPPPSIPGGQ